MCVCMNVCMYVCMNVCMYNKLDMTDNIQIEPFAGPNTRIVSFGMGNITSSQHKLMTDKCNHQLPALIAGLPYERAAVIECSCMTCKPCSQPNSKQQQT